jgi:SAM-dependent methyltransferase
VTAFDLSPGSVAKARRRAEVQGVADRIQFDVRAAGETGYPRASFDVVTGFNILHHIHWNLPAIYEEIAGLLTPHGTAYFIEPVANSAVLRALRRIMPVPCDATPDERQLLYRDFEPLRQHFSSVRLEHFYCLERLHRLTGGRGRRLLRWVDHRVQRVLPFLRRYYGLLLVTAVR